MKIGTRVLGGFILVIALLTMVAATEQQSTNAREVSRAVENVSGLTRQLQRLVGQFRLGSQAPARLAVEAKGVATAA